MTPPKINIDQMTRGTGCKYVSDDTPLNSGPLNSEIARTGRLTSDSFARHISDLKLHSRMHRKDWELGYILEALHERDMIKSGARGLAFAVGRERTPAYLAARGCNVLATDLGADDDRSDAWQATNQWSGALEHLLYDDICSLDVMQERVTFRPVDMNNLPDDLRNFDFTWSTCSFEHCGSLELGLAFLKNQMACLRDGGVAVHTTEFNLTSNDDTISKGGTVVYRLKDIEGVVGELEAAGHHVMPLDVRNGLHELDWHVDMPSPENQKYSQDRHMRLQLGTYACTSIGLIITKKGGSDRTKAARGEH